MRNSCLLFPMIISFLYGSKSHQQFVPTPHIKEYIMSIRDVQYDYNSIQNLVFSPLQSIDDMDYKRFAETLKGLYDTLVMSEKILLEKLKSIENLSEMEIGLIDTLDIYAKFFGETIIQLSFICAKLYNYSNAISYPVNEYSRDMKKWEKLSDNYRLFGHSINGRLDELTINVPRFYQF